MRKSNTPANTELPSTEQLIKSTLLAAVTAGVLLVTVVMPAEYGIDPTGIGNLIGLKKMGEIRVSLEKEIEAEKANTAGISAETQPDEANAVVASPPAISTPQAASTPQASDAGAILNHEMQVTLAPDEGVEIKLKMSEGNVVQYAWSTDGGKANFDVHADSQELGIDYHQYAKGSEQSAEGNLEAAFNGSHGWFWRNRTSDPLVITLQTQGEYTEINRM